MIDKQIGERIKQYRKRLGLTQEEFAEKTGLTVNYISSVERGASFPRYENLITIINTLQVSADAIFCDVINHSLVYKASELSDKLAGLPLTSQDKILEIVELLICQEKRGSNS